MRIALSSPSLIGATSLTGVNVFINEGKVMYPVSCATGVLLCLASVSLNNF